ncbi:hypothetical protein B0A49_09187 [Cryomyces minteri]|uniref:Uncharacterized protein n=1 Tax=Cryomyces minteri TaxID=331657 RepID=A0A4U0VY61_9PEZI|nr:hypothetical protein B0A49_09187 [Cryomyces minteri]
MNPCMQGYTAGRDTVVFTTPYTYAQVMSIIGSYQNLTWSGSPDGSVSLNGTDNTVGTARTYDVGGVHVVETISVYSKPAAGPYYEVHSLAPVTITALNKLSFYGEYDATTVTPVCGGMASMFNLTIDFCATNASLAESTLHSIHLADAMTVGVFLGNQNFTTCAALGAANGTAMASATAMGSATAMASATATASKPATYTGGAAAMGSGALLAGGAAVVAAFIL